MCSSIYCAEGKEKKKKKRREAEKRGFGYK